MARARRCARAGHATDHVSLLVRGGWFDKSAVRNVAHGSMTTRRCAR
jgi:hypothetical protein